MRGVLVALAVLCLGLGVFPGLVANQLGLVAQDLLALENPLVLGPAPMDLALSETTVGVTYDARLSMPALLLPVGLPLALGLGVSVLHGRRRRGPLWNCGTAYRPESMQISGGAFSFLIWEWAGGQRARSAPGSEPGAEGESESPGQGAPVPWRLFQSENRYVGEYFRKMMNAALIRALRAAERFGEWFQGGDIRQYLAYLFIVFVLALLVSVLWGG